MNQVRGGSGQLRRLAVLLLVATLSAGTLAGCSADDDDGGGSTSGGGGDGPTSGTSVSTTSASPSVTSTPVQGDPLGEQVQCPNSAYLTMVAVPATLSGLLRACTNGSDDILLKNVSAVMLRVQPTNSTSLTAPVRASDTFRGTVNAQLAAEGSSASASLVPPDGYVIAYADGVPATVNVEISLPNAATAYAADVLARYVESKATPRPQRLANSAVKCAKDASDLWSANRQEANLDLDQLLAETAFGPAMSCRKLFAEVSEQLNEEPPDNESRLAREFKGLQKDVKASVWEDLAQFVRRLVQVVHRG